MEENPDSSDVPLDSSIQKKEFVAPLGPAPKIDTPTNFAVPSLPSRPKKLDTNVETKPEIVKSGEVAGFGLTMIEKEVEVVIEEQPEERKVDPTIPPLYTPPFWSAKPNLNYTLELIKNGVSKGKIPMHEKSWYLFGRAPICDILLDNPGISRQHAVIQFRKNGDAYLFDLDSAQGTFLGKNKIKPKRYIGITQGNNVIKFGNSTRLYVLDNGKVDYSSSDSDDNAIEVDEEKIAKKLEKKQKKEEKKEEWKKKKEREKQRKDKEKEKEKKEARLNDPIASDDVGSEDEETIEPSEADVQFFKEYYESDDDDEFYDRTGRVAKKKIQAEKNNVKYVETYDTLTAKCNILKNHQQSLLNEIKLSEEELTSIKEKIKDIPEESEDVDAYVHELNLKTIDEKIKRKRKLLNELTQELYQVTKIADIARPSLTSLSNHTNFTDAQIGRVNEFENSIKQRKYETDGGKNLEEEKNKEVRAQMKDLAKSLKANPKQKQTVVNKPKAIQKPTTQAKENNNNNNNNNNSENNNENNNNNNNNNDMMVESNTVNLPEEGGKKKHRIGGTAMMSGVTEALAKQKSLEESKKRKLERGEDDDDEEDEKEKKKEKKIRKKNSFFDEDAEGNYVMFDSWTPPVGQTGDGKTHLNDKYGY
jgi:pSer/pThr/pTyr-binding forkhead associated (FHA) protein